MTSTLGRTRWQRCVVQLTNAKRIPRRSQHTQGYQSVGSFHSDDLGMLMSLSDEEYQAPPLPVAVEAANEKSPSLQEDGSDFLLDRENWTFLNHGAFGAALKVGHRRAELWRWHLEQQPLRYFDRDLLPNLAYATRRLAAFCSESRNNSDKQARVRQGITLIQNATAGLNSVLKGYRRVYGPDSRVILWDTSYGSLKKLAAHVFEPHQIIEIPFQSTYMSRFAENDPHQVFLEALDDTIHRHDCATIGHCLLVLDHTTSNTAINMPIEEIASHVKQTYDNIQVAVDGAHGLLAQKVDLEAYCGPGGTTSNNIDYYVANGHKWLSCPRGVGMLFCPDADLRETVLAEPAIISHGVDETDLLSRFVWDGCRDYAAALALPAVLDYWEARNVDSVRSNMKHSLVEGIQCLADHWHDSSCGETDWLRAGITLVPTSLLGPMALVRLPRIICGSPTDIKTSKEAKEIQDFLFDHHIEVPIKCINGELFVRVSCHVYNEVAEFDRLAKVILTFPN
ncbi:Cysteine desulfurase [Seminavis robusta]|uniref:Cysteine desulfurase n=1 Tax=Seminavis robusta TaxID=568900 RepID=A0A9N8E7Z3_9STRA|nr:Cysteine desulfurase [Seminavis robusta]|eukprot:Sro753_g197290.1 Cysteine desulfurase (509) ;mRNA; r:7121-8647